VQFFTNKKSASYVGWLPQSDAETELTSCFSGIFPMILLQAIEEHGKYTNCTSELNPAYFFHLESAATVEVMTMQVRRDFSDPRVAEMLSTPQC